MLIMFCKPRPTSSKFIGPDFSDHEEYDEDDKGLLKIFNKNHLEEDE